jgi:hypothetical protein
MREKDLVWREDMDVFVLEMLRRQVVQLLKYTIDRKGYVEEWPLDQRKPPAPPGCALWLEDVSQGVADGVRTPPRAVCEIVTTGQRPMHNTFPAYNFAGLLGARHAASLKADGLQELSRCARVVVREKLGTVDLLMALWKLKCYTDGMEEYTEMVEEGDEVKKMKKAEHMRLRKEHWEKLQREDQERGIEPRSISEKVKKRRVRQEIPLGGE